MKANSKYSHEFKKQSFNNPNGNKKEGADKKIISSKSSFSFDLPIVYAKEMGPLICDKSRSNKVSFVKDGDRIPVYVVK